MVSKLVVFSPSWGGLQLSDKAIERLRELGVIENDNKFMFTLQDPDWAKFGVRNKQYWGNPYYLSRDDPRLVQVIMELGDEALGDECNIICIAEIPDGVEVYIEQDSEFGCEYIAEVRRTWRGPEDSKYMFERGKE